MSGSKNQGEIPAFLAKSRIFFCVITATLLRQAHKLSEKAFFIAATLSAGMRDYFY